MTTKLRLARVDDPFAGYMWLITDLPETGEKPSFDGELALQYEISKGQIPVLYPDRSRAINMMLRTKDDRLID